MVTAKYWYALLEGHATQSPNKTAFIEWKSNQLSEKISYQDFFTRVKQLAAVLQQQGLSEKICAVFLPAGIDIAVTIMACYIAGVIPVIKTIFPDILPERLRHQLAQINSVLGEFSVVITTQTIKKQLEQFIEKPLIIVSIETNQHEDDLSNLSICANEIAMIQMTSGSTGAPKAVYSTHKNVINNLWHCAQVWEYFLESITLSWAPHSHIFGLVTGILLPLYAGSTSILMSPSDFSSQPLSWLQLISAYRVSHSGAPCFAYQRCVQEYDAAKLIHCDLYSWKVATLGGDLVNKTVLQHFNRLFSVYGFSDRSFCPSYGMTENTGLVCSLAACETPNLSFSAVSVGMPLDESIIQIIEPKTAKILPDGERGEIVISGESLCAGYIGEVESDVFYSFVDATGKNRIFYKTGDVGFIQNKQLYIVGRRKEILIINGKNYIPAEIEQCVKHCDDLALLSAAAAFSVMDEHGTEHKLFYFKS